MMTLSSSVNKRLHNTFLFLHSGFTFL